jgi:nucleoid-associated protein EbfC
MARGRMPGGPGGMDLGALMKQAQQMQTDMAKVQEELKDEEVDASAGGGMVKVKVSGDLAVKEITIDPDAVDPGDVEMLQDLVLAAVNEGIRAAQERAEAKMGGITGGLGGLPGM